MDRSMNNISLAYGHDIDHKRNKSINPTSAEKMNNSVLGDLSEIRHDFSKK